MKVNSENSFLSVRRSWQDKGDKKAIEATAVLLNRPVCFVDEEGYERKILGAAIHTNGRRVAYVESREKSLEECVDVTIKIHSRDEEGGDRSVDIESHNPFFGCSVQMFEWIGDIAMLMYREKNRMYVCRIDKDWPPRFVKIEDCWWLQDGTIYYCSYRRKDVYRLSFPELEELEPISLAAAKEKGMEPPDWALPS